MSDDIARQRFWSWNNTKPEPTKRMPRAPRSRSRSRVLRSTAVATHVLIVRIHGHREWSIVADAHGDVQGSEAFCQAEVVTRTRHYQRDEFRALPWSEAKRELRRKTWSVHDDDHIPIGEQVMLAVAPEQLHPSLTHARAVFGIPGDDHQRRTGVVKSRNRRSGDYMVRIDGGGLSVSVARADLIYPVPENVVALERRARR